MKETIADSQIHEGHRQRMRAKILTHGQKIFDTYELLEMLLYYVIPYKDTNPVAKRLLAAFGSLDAVLSASVEELKAVNGIGDAAARFLTRVGAVSNVLDSEMRSTPKTDFADYSALGEYLVDYFSSQNYNGVAALFFDNNMRLLHIEKVYDLDFSSGGVKPGRFLDLAIRNRASVVITAHSHPRGPFYPTQGDLATNEAVTSALRMAGIYHPEHYIICGDCFAGASSLKNFTHKFSQYPMLDAFVGSKAAAISMSNVEGALLKKQRSLNKIGNDCDEELLAYLKELFLPVSTRDGKCAVESILNRYRTLEGAMTASISELSEIGGEGFACYVKLLAYVTSRRSTDVLLDRRSAIGSADVSAYLKALFLGTSIETAYLLCFDSDGHFIDATVVGEGTVNSTDVLLRKALEKAIERKADCVVLAHNHPFGSPEASSDDVKLTNVMNEAFSACGMNFLGHYIVAGQLCNAIIIK